MRRYSRTEKSLLKLLPKNGRKISTPALTLAHYGKLAGRKAAQQTISWTLRSLVEKVKANKENFRVRSTKHAGPYPQEHWIEMKGN